MTTQDNSWLEDLMAALTEMPVVAKDANNPHFQSKYADLPSIMKAVKPILQKYRYVLMQPLLESPRDMLLLKTQLIHASGHILESITSMPLEKVTPQGYGSAVTYLRRYALGAMLAIVTDEDDDGNTASGIDHVKASQTTISDKQVKRGWVIASKAGYDKADISKILNSKGVKGMENLTHEQYNSFMEWLERNPRQTGA